MKQIRQAIAAALLVAGCATRPPGSVVVQWHRTAAADVDAACKRAIYTAPHIGTYRACSWFDAGGVFHIIAPDVQGVDECAYMRRLGHELAHGFKGNWHQPHETMEPGACT